MVARLKLKEIDGRAPPGVNRAVVHSAPAARKGPWEPSLNASDRAGLVPATGSRDLQTAGTA